MLVRWDRFICIRSKPGVVGSFDFEVGLSGAVRSLGVDRDAMRSVHLSGMHS